MCACSRAAARAGTFRSGFLGIENSKQNVCRVECVLLTMIHGGEIAARPGACRRRRPGGGELEVARDGRGGRQERDTVYGFTRVKYKINERTLFCNIKELATPLRSDSPRRPHATFLQWRGLCRTGPLAHT